ncbi:MAG: hypothetical protein A2Y12_16240 [Planctomycetes bacterium GWF2_42_9]|nr:MAG: hypothetical protein A2Y12_16240 [Planctomycetes bacterium GWF2_42_9]
MKVTLMTLSEMRSLIVHVLLVTVPFVESQPLQDTLEPKSAVAVITILEPFVIEFNTEFIDGKE